MILKIHSNKFYLSELKAPRREGSNFYMGHQNSKNPRETSDTVHIVSNTMKNVMGSAA